MVDASRINLFFLSQRIIARWMDKEDVRSKLQKLGHVGNLGGC